MIRISQIRLQIRHTKAELEQKIYKILKLKEETPFSFRIVKKSIDARKKPELFYSYTVDIEMAGEDAVLRRVNDRNVTKVAEKTYRLLTCGTKRRDDGLPVVIAGAGPAGLFCAYALAQRGIVPVVAERGKRVEERMRDVALFWETGVLNPASNVQFGEGGAGTFSDGKLNTLVKDPAGRNRFVLETFVKFGAPEEILYESRPHIGTDVLSGVIRRMRKAMEEMGVVFRFETCLTDYRAKDGKLTEIELNHNEWMPAGCLILAIGHSARDTFRMLEAKGELAMEAKPFAVGLRVEHPQEQINIGQYGPVHAAELPAALYKLTASAKDGRGVYTFCMCPGGYVVNASSEEGRLAVNGMSYSGRTGKNANSAVIVTVTPEDFFRAGGSGALAGIRFQQTLEERAYALSGGKIPQQLFGDYCAGRASAYYGEFESETKGERAMGNLRGLLPVPLENAFIEGMHRFSRQISNFDRYDAILSGVESRTSSPVRIPRKEDFMSDVAGIYPCGEGAGYAGGIMSAAMDGLKVAEAVCAL